LLIKTSFHKNVCVIADNCLILREITHPHASSWQKATGDEFFPRLMAHWSKMPRQEKGMKRTALAFLMLPALAHADWSSPGFTHLAPKAPGFSPARQSLRRVRVL
jgi:hypothetical protein